MKKALEKIWSDCFAEDCAAIETDEEKELAKKTAELCKEVNKMLTEEQKSAAQKYMDAIYEMQSVFVKKAFFNGCVFALRFAFEAGCLGKE